MDNPTTDAPVSVQSRTLGLFAKAWDPGKVKTRLAKTLGDGTAAKIYLELLILHLLRFAHSADQRIVVYSPANDETKTRFESLTGKLKPKPVWRYVPQVEADLGTRLSCFVQDQFNQGSKKVVVIGSDAPRLTTEILDDAFCQLDKHDAVFGPSTDGGYYLVGLKAFNGAVFQGIDWSTEKVLQQSMEKCQEVGFSVALLEPLADIDEAEDLEHELGLMESSEDALDRTFLEFVSGVLNRGMP